MPGEFFTILLKKTNKPFFVSFKCRNAKDGDDDRGRGAAESMTLARTGKRRESMPGEFFTIILLKKILTNHLFVAFKYRKADGDDNL